MTDLPHLTNSESPCHATPHTPKEGGGVASVVPQLPNHCQTPSVAGVAGMVPLATFRKLKGQLREERRFRAQAEAERDQLKTTLGDVLQGIRDGEFGKWKGTGGRR